MKRFGGLGWLCIFLMVTLCLNAATESVLAQSGYIYPVPVSGGSNMLTGNNVTEPNDVIGPAPALPPPPEPWPTPLPIYVPPIGSTTPIIGPILDGLVCLGHQHSAELQRLCYQALDAQYQACLAAIPDNLAPADRDRAEAVCRRDRDFMRDICAVLPDILEEMREYTCIEGGPGMIYFDFNPPPWPYGEPPEIFDPFWPYEEYYQYLEQTRSGP